MYRGASRRLPPRRAHHPQATAAGEPCAPGPGRAGTHTSRHLQPPPPPGTAATARPLGPAAHGPAVGTSSGFFTEEASGGAESWVTGWRLCRPRSGERPPSARPPPRPWAAHARLRGFSFTPTLGAAGTPPPSPRGTRGLRPPTRQAWPPRPPSPRPGAPAARPASPEPAPRPRRSQLGSAGPPPPPRPLAGCHVTLRGNQELRGAGGGGGWRGGEGRGGRTARPRRGAARRTPARPRGPRPAPRGAGTSPRRPQAPERLGCGAGSPRT